MIRNLIIFFITILITFCSSQDISNLPSDREILFKSEQNRFAKLPGNLNSILTNDNYDVTGYTLDLNLEPGRRLLTGVVTIQGLSNFNGLNTVDLNLENNTFSLFQKIFVNLPPLAVRRNDEPNLKFQVFAPNFTVIHSAEAVQKGRSLRSSREGGSSKE